MMTRQLLMKGDAMFGEAKHLQELGKKTGREAPPCIPGIVSDGRHQGTNRTLTERFWQVFR